MNAWIRRLTTAAAALALSGAGLMTAGATAAGAETYSPGAYGSGTWEYHPPGSYEVLTAPQPASSVTTLDPPQTTVSEETAYRAGILQPVNADGTSVFPAKSRTVPVKFGVQQATSTVTVTTTTERITSRELYPGGDLNGGGIEFHPEATLHVSDIQELIATYHNGVAPYGQWYINIPVGGIIALHDVLTGSNAITDVGMVYDIHNHYISWQQALTEWGNAQVSSIAFQASLNTQLDKLQINDNSYVPGFRATGDIAGNTTTVVSDPVMGPWTATNAPPAWLHLARTSAQPPATPVDEPVISLQGDAGMQFRQADGIYIYNLPLSQLTDKSATYEASIQVGSSTAEPLGAVQFGLK